MPRPGAAEVTRDELMIMDPMFNVGIREAALASDRYASHFNLPYSHLLGREALAQVIDGLRRRGLIRERAGWLKLTRQGGESWETARRPDWPRYCLISTTTLGRSELQSLWITAVRKSVGRACLTALLRCGFYKRAKRGEVRWARYGDVIYWNPRLKGWRARLVVEATERGDVERFSREVGWWGEIKDVVVDARGTRA